MNKNLLTGIIVACIVVVGILVVFVFDVGEVEEEPIVTPICPCDVDMDCHNFTTQEEAQACFEYCGGPELDPHGLDGNRDGIVCETLALG